MSTAPEPWALVTMLDGRPEVHFTFPLKSLAGRTAGVRPPYLIWLARQYGYALSTATAIAAGFVSVTLVRDDSDAARQRAARTRANHPGAGHGGPLPGLVFAPPAPGIPTPGLVPRAELTAELKVWERAVLRECYGPWSPHVMSAGVLASAALVWFVILLSTGSEKAGQLVFAGVAAVFLSAASAVGLAGDRIHAARIHAAGYRKVPDGRGEQRYVHRDELLPPGYFPGH
ncbi:hypothetical protein ACFY12_03825 [Streptomyces sp. NPDC001339]|uniref:hypothetical protein n=1 Tax=Streptomyces sp. NPDC001339 TaxID=3364563 RepID=UPI003678CD3A